MLWVFKNSQDMKFLVVAVALMPQHTVVISAAYWVFSISGRNIYAIKLDGKMAKNGEYIWSWIVAVKTCIKTI